MPHASQHWVGVKSFCSLCKNQNSSPLILEETPWLSAGICFLSLVPLPLEDLDSASHLPQCLHSLTILGDFSIYTRNSPNNLACGLLDLLNSTNHLPPLFPLGLWPQDLDLLITCHCPASENIIQDWDHLLVQTSHSTALHSFGCETSSQLPCFNTSSPPEWPHLCPRMILSHLDLHQKLSPWGLGDLTPYVQLPV